MFVICKNREGGIQMDNKKTTKVPNSTPASNFHRGAVVGAAFLMATSAIGPGFLTQTATFTGSLQANFGFVILAAVLLSAFAQMNIWRVLCSSGLRGQDVGNKVLPGLGVFLSALIVLGGLVFNIGNVGGAALGFETLLGIPRIVGYFLGGGLAILIFLSKDAKGIMDQVAKILGGIMIVVILVVIFIVKPPIGEAVARTFLPNAEIGALMISTITLLGGTVGGYISFAGAHRLIDAKVTGKENLDRIMKSSILGIGVAAIVRVFLFLAVLGVVSKGVTLAKDNPAADAFLQGAGQIGYRFAGLVLLCAALTSIIGAAYTSVSFLKTFHKSIADRENLWIIAFIAISTVVMAVLGSPATLLVLAGSLNGLILPVALAICLIASQRKDIVGEDYTHPKWLFIAGILVVLVSGYLGITSLSRLSTLF